MSKDLVVQSNALVVREKFRDVAVVDDVQGWLQRMQSGSEFFTPVLGRSEALRIWKKTGVPLASTVVSMGGMIVGFIPMTWMMFSGFSELAYGSVMVGLSTVPAGLVAARPLLFRRRERMLKHVLVKQVELNREALKAWLKARYGIQVSDEVLKELIVEDKNNFDYGRVAPVFFGDDQNNQWQIISDPDQPDSFFVRAAPKKLAEREISPIEVKSVVSAAVPVVAQAAFDALQSKFAVLEASDAGVELKHVVARSREDVRQALSLYERLSVLGREGEAAQLLATSLALVAEDVDRALDELADDVVQEFAVQGAYLKERLNRNDAGLLSLVKASQQEPSALEKL